MTRLMIQTVVVLAALPAWADGWQILGDAVLGKPSASQPVVGELARLRLKRPKPALREAALRAALDRLKIPLARSGPALCLSVNGAAGPRIALGRQGATRLAGQLGVPSPILAGRPVLHARLDDVDRVFDRETLGEALFLALLARAGSAATLWLDPPAHPREVELQLRTVKGAQIRLPARLDGADLPKDVAWRIGGLGRRFPVVLGAAAQGMLLLKALRGKRLTLSALRRSSTWRTWTSAWRRVQTHQAVLTDRDKAWLGQTTAIHTELRGRFTRADDKECAAYLDLEVRHAPPEAEAPLLGEPHKAHVFDPARHHVVVGFRADPVCTAP